MITILNGNEKFLIESEIKKIIKDAKVDTMNIVEYDGNDKAFNIDDLINDCLTLPFFSDKKVVLLKDPQFLKIKKKKADDEEEDVATNLDGLMKYIERPSYETELVIYSYDFNFAKTLKIYKALTKNANIKNFNALSEAEFRTRALSIARQNELQISDEAMDKLIVNSSGQLSILLSNIEKLKLYGAKIDLSVIEKLTDPYIEDKSYELTSAIFHRDTKLAIKIYRDLIALDTSNFMINATLATTMRTYHELNYYVNEHYCDDDIAKKMDINPRRLYFMKKDLTSFRNVNFLKMLSALSKIDQQLKSTSSFDENERFEILLINLMRAN